MVAIARWMCAAGAALAVATILAMLPVNEFGIFGRLEFGVLILYAATALAATGLCVAVWSTQQPRRLFANPVSLVLALLGLWSIAVAPLAELPWRSLLGPPQTGQGGLMMLGLAAIAAAISWLRPSRLLFGFIVVAAVLSGWTVAALQILTPYWPLDVPAFYALTSLCVFALVAALPIGPDRAALFAVLAALPPLAISENRSAMAIVVMVGLPIFFVVRSIVQRPHLLSLKQLRQMLSAVAVALTIIMSGVAWWLGHLNVVISLTARARINDVMWTALQGQPLAGLWGLGWGGTSDAFLRYLRSGADQLSVESWDAIGRDFHSAHSLVSEFFLSTGIPGLIAGLMLAAVVPLFAPKRILPAASAFTLSFAALSVLWYQQAYTLGMTVAALVALAPRYPGTPGRANAPRLARYILSAVAVGLVLATVWLARYGLAVDRAIAAATDNRCAENFPADSGRGDLGLRYALYGAVVRGRAAAALASGPDAAEARRIAALTCATDRRLEQTPSLHLAFSAIVVRGEISTTPLLLPSDYPIDALLQSWPDRLHLWLSLAPHRTDMAVPYLAWLVGRGDFTAVARTAADLLRIDSQDSVGLWFSGLAMVRSPDPATVAMGRQRMRQALDNGFERVLPLPEEIVKQLK